MNMIKSILNTFAYVTTGVVFGTAVFINIFEGNARVSVGILWEILGVSFLCSMGNLIYYDKNIDYYYYSYSKRQRIIRTILHYLYINIVVLGCGLTFEWIYWNRIDMIAVMIALIMIIFILIWSINFLRHKKVATQLNEKLEEFYRREQ